MEALQLHQKKTKKLSDNMTRSEGAEHPDNMTVNEEEELSDDMTGYENEDGYDLLDHRVLMVDLKKEQEKSEKRISFFQILLRRHMKKEFSKLEKDDQVGKIFEIMVNKKYDKNQILSIRRLMNGGMTNEFIFSLLEKDLPETELTNLCETLLNEENDLSGLSENMKADETGGDEE